MKFLLIHNCILARDLVETESQYNLFQSWAMSRGFLENFVTISWAVLDKAAEGGLLQVGTLALSL
jgi:hypothetical protein